jgi:S-layer homology domain
MSTEQARGLRAAAFALLWTAAAFVWAATETRSGTVQILTADDFASGHAEQIVTLVSTRGDLTALRLPSGVSLEPGARVAVHGSPEGDVFAVETVEVLEAAPVQPPAITGSSTVIAILLKFLDTGTEPFTVAQVQDKVFGASGTSAYYAEASYGAHTLSGVVTQWLTATVNTPTTCDYITVANQAVARAQAAGYNPGSYQKQVYFFPHLPCGWSGLGGGSQAWINQSNSVLVIGHELGHCFGLGHSSSLDCGDVVLGGSCTVSEYGDRFSIMGNSAARHFPAHYKYLLGYLPPGSYPTHTSGSAVYTIAPIETPGGSLYAVQIPVPESQYTYWLEYRQPIGFDAGMSGNPISGALVHLGPGYPTYSCYSCLLDMTPTTSGFGDAALAVGETYTDASAALHVTPLSADASGLVVQVELGPAPPFAVDRHSTPGHVYPNGVLEAGEVATVEPSYLNSGGMDAVVTGTATAFTGPAGATYSISDSGADYGTVSPGARAPCFDATADCYAVLVSAATRPAPHWDATFEETLSDTSVRTWPLHIGGSFSDAASSRADYRYVETVFHHGITSGCGSGVFCPDASVSRAQMAVFLLRAEHGAAYAPPLATGQVFSDVPANSFAAAWIERLAAEGITAGCGNGTKFCPSDPVTRAQMAAFLLKTEHGSSWTPPPATGEFNDVPVSNPFAPWVEALKDEGVTAGCGGGAYCPSQATRRGQMAVFLTKTFGLQLYGP